MPRNDWFRNKEWNPQIEEWFFAKLARARRKGQYLRVQACMLANSHPQVALDLLEKYFATGELFDAASAYVHQADAYLALGADEKAFDAYERALAREEERPNYRTQASIELPFLIATRRRRERYGRALKLLEKKETLLFRGQLFKCEASLALISADLGDRDMARQHAIRALEIAELRDSGLRYHAGVGLVGSKLESTRALLKALVSP
jgi:tetratricopeptide (TPR) repeat protein